MQENTPDPRQALFLSYYLDPTSPTFSNAKQSAIRATYSEEYADNITSQMPAWLSDSLGHARMVERAERHLDEVLGVPILVQAMGAFGPLFRKIPTGQYKYVTKKGKRKKVEMFDEEPIMVYNPSLMREKEKAVEFVLAAHKKALYGKEPKQANSPGIAIQVNVDRDREKFA